MFGFQVRDRGWLFDFGLAVVVSLFAVTPVSSDIGMAAGSVILCSALMFRRIMPSLALGLGLLGALILLVVSEVPQPAIVVVPLLVYGLARWSGGNLGRIALIAGLAGAVVGPLRWAGFYRHFENFGVFGLMVLAAAAVVLGAFLLGSRIRESRLRDVERRDADIRQQVLVEAEREQRAQVVTISERNRIARELHDIVAHSLSVIVVQAEGGRALAGKRPESAPEVFGTIAETGRQALAETRHIVGLLRGEAGPGDPAVYTPTPGLADLADLVRRTSDAYELIVFGTPPSVTQAVGLTVYRIVQESLTNVLKHAGPQARARVTVAYTADAIEVEIVDDGLGGAAPGAGGTSAPAGHGHEGMRERVAVHGGQLSVGPRVGGGFAVRVWVPLSADSMAGAGG